MKLAFSNDCVQAKSFLELCNITSEYGFSGFEISDAKKEKAEHEDSIFHTSVQAASKRKLVNRHIGISVLNFNEYITAQTDAEKLCKCVQKAANAGIGAVTVKFKEIPDAVVLKEISGGIEN